MKLYLIRHGETVDNVAQVYAGHRDSELTNHGFQQANRLGQHFRREGVVFTHIFSSSLRRALKTAELIKAAQQELEASTHANPRSVDVVALPGLMEQYFGAMEGMSFGQAARWRESMAAWNNSWMGSDAGESSEGMATRMDQFLDHHLLPLLHTSNTTSQLVVAIVSHGIILAVLWRQLITRFSSKNVSIRPGIVPVGTPVVLDRLCRWSNTGYLELMLQRQQLPEQSITQPLTQIPLMSTVTQTDAWGLRVLAINCKEHLVGLKRTGGGIGSAKHTEGQQTLDKFFKRRRIE